MSGPSAAARVAVPVALVLAVLLAYAGALHGPFQFDDWWSIVGDARVHSVQSWWQAQRTCVGTDRGGFAADDVGIW